MNNPKDDTDRELEEILLKYKNYLGRDLMIEHTLPELDSDEAKAALLDLFKREMERIIGANESTQRGQLIYPNRKDRIKNDLRSEQREALDKLISKEE